MKVSIYNEKSGNPFLDNEARRRNRMINRGCRGRMILNTPRGRKHSHRVMGLEYPKYVKMVGWLTDYFHRNGFEVSRDA